MKSLLAVSLLMIGSVLVASANIAPEIDPASAGSAIALLSGVLVVYRGSRR
jgi:hypothetical protein